MRLRFCCTAATIGLLLLSGTADEAIAAAQAAECQICAPVHSLRARAYHRRLRRNRCDAPQALDAALASADSRLKNADFDGAIASYTTAIRLDPKCVDAYCGRGRAHFNRHEDELALADFSKALQLDPKCANAHAFRGSVYGRQGDLKKALAECNKALQLDPKNQFAYSVRGTVYIHDTSDKWDLAIADFNEAVRLDPDDSKTYANRGGAFALQGKFDAAIADCTEAIRLNPKDDAAYNTRGWAHCNKKEIEAALADFSVAIRLAPGEVKAYNNRGMLLGQKREYDKAIADFSEAIRVDPKDPVGYLYRARCFASQKQYDTAIADLDAAIRLNPGVPMWYEMRAAFCIYNGDCDRAIADLQTMLRLNPEDPAARFKPEQKEPISAASLQHGQRQVRRMLHDRPAMASLGEKAAPLTRWAARKFAGEDLHQEILWDPSAPPPGASAQHELPMPGQPGRILIAQRYREGAQTGRELSFEEMWHGAVYEFYNITNRERFFRIVSDAARGRLSRTEYATQIVAAESRAAELTRAFYIDVFLPWAKQNGVATHPDLWYLARSNRSEDLLLPYVNKKGDYWQSYLRQYETIAPRSMIEKEECEEAIAQASEAESKAATPEQKAAARLARGIAYAKMRQYDKAIADFDKVIQRNADNAAAYEARADAYTQKCQYDKAVADYNEAIRRAAKNSQLRLRRGTIFAWQGKFDAALADVSAAVALDPKNQEARDSRDWIKKRAAEKMAAALTPQRPETGSSVDHNKIDYQSLGNKVK